MSLRLIIAATLLSGGYLATPLMHAEPVPVQTPAPNGTITGTVVDETGEPMIGATVTVKGTGVATATDINGHFSIKANTGATLVITFIG